MTGKNVTQTLRFAGIMVCMLVPFASTAQQSGAKAKPAKEKSKAVQRGGYLVRVGGCNDCHTPWVFDKSLNMPVPDMSRMLSGHAADAPDPSGTAGAQDIGLIGPTFTSFKMPFGIVYSSNLTPDVETGLGSWTETNFIKAMRTGKHFGGNGRAILPPMPWMNLAGMTDEDLKAVFAFLRSIPAIRNPVRDNKVPPQLVDALTESFDKMLKGTGKH